MAGRDWGYASGPKHAWVRAVRLQIFVDQGDDYPLKQLGQLSSAFDDWFRIAKNWLCAWTGQVRGSRSPDDHSQIHVVLPTTSGQLALYGSPLFAGGVIIGERSPTRNEVLAAFARASASDDVPLPYEFLLRAVSEEPRQAIIDSCTAAEVALSAAVRQFLQESQVPTKSLDSILRTTGVVELFRIFLVIGGRPDVSESRVMDQLAYPRNNTPRDGSRLRD